MREMSELLDCTEVRQCNCRAPNFEVSFPSGVPPSIVGWSTIPNQSVMIYESPGTGDAGQNVTPQRAQACQSEVKCR